MDMPSLLKQAATLIREHTKELKADSEKTASEERPCSVYVDMDELKVRVANGN